MNSIQLGGYTFDSRLREAGFEVAHGWDKELKKELVEKSSEAVIAEMTPRDSLERFSSLETAQRWFESKEKTVYALLSHTGLAGILWFSTELYKDIPLTMALRLYREARGRHLAQPFGTTALYHNERFNNYRGDVWLDTSIMNLTAQHAFRRLGFAFDGQVDPSTGRVKMIRPGVITRLTIEKRAEE